MNGEIAEPWDKTIKNPKQTSAKINGSSQYFFLCLIKSINSFKNEIIKTEHPY